jgi:flagellar basal-body rod protein FlgF
MVRGIQTNAGAMRAALLAQDILANNLANASTPGFRQSRVGFHMAALPAPPVDGAAATPPMPDAVARIDQSPGVFQVTDDRLDLAIQGEGYFVVQTVNGERYTRSGHFQLAQDGTLSTSQGDPVLTDGGPVLVPAGANLEVAADGTLRAGDQVLGRLQVVTFADGGAGLRHAGAGLLASDSGSQPSEGASVLQGVLEAPNVTAVQSMVDMITLLRHFEMNQRAIRTQDETLGRLIDWARQ